MPETVPTGRVQNGVEAGVVQVRPGVVDVIEPNVAPVSTSLIVVAASAALGSRTVRQ